MRALLDDELVAFDADGRPDFPLVCEGVLHRRVEIPLTLVALDVRSIGARRQLVCPSCQGR